MPTGRGVPQLVEDTVLVAPRQTVNIDVRADTPGRWMPHCHNTFHIGSGMMTLLDSVTLQTRRAQSLDVHRDQLGHACKASPGSMEESRSGSRAVWIDQEHTRLQTSHLGRMAIAVVNARLQRQSDCGTGPAADRWWCSRSRSGSGPPLSRSCRSLKNAATLGGATMGLWS